jgi:hypothetical protein
MRNVLVLSTVGSVLALGLGGFGAAAVEPTSGQGLVQKVQTDGDKAPGARRQDGDGKSTTPGSREGRGGPVAGQDKSGEKGAAPQGQREKGAAREQRGEKGTELRSGEKGARGGKQRSTDVEVRGGRDGSRADRRTRIDIDVERGRRTGGRDVDIRERGYRERGYGYTGGGGLSCREVLRRYKQCVGR